MKNKVSFWKTRQGNSVKRGISLFFPYILWTVSLLFVAIFLFHTVISESVYFRLLFQNVQQQEMSDTPAVPPEVEDPEDFPPIYYLSQWATINVDGWTKNTDIPAYFGNDTELIKKGACTPSYTHFAGQGGKIILSAHVTRHFEELEDTEVGTLITLDTLYGKYVYRVEEKVIFKATDAERYIHPSDEEETLVMYTCYPHKNNYKARTKRCALICSKVSGKDW